jgi:hypothetical protein
LNRRRYILSHDLASRRVRDRAPTRLTWKFIRASLLCNPISPFPLPNFLPDLFFSSEFFVSFSRTKFRISVFSLFATAHLSDNFHLHSLRFGGGQPFARCLLQQRSTTMKRWRSSEQPLMMRSRAPTDALQESTTLTRISTIQKPRLLSKR